MEECPYTSQMRRRLLRQIPNWPVRHSLKPGRLTPRHHEVTTPLQVFAMGELEFACDQAAECVSCAKLAIARDATATSGCSSLAVITLYPC